MDEIIFIGIWLAVMITAWMFARYLLPWLRERISAEKLAMVEKWAKYAVLKAQQVLWEESGADRKAYVTDFLKELLKAKNLSLTDQQLDILIEAAVKQMKIEENAGIVIEATDAVPAETE